MDHGKPPSQRGGRNSSKDDNSVKDRAQDGVIQLDTARTLELLDDTAPGDACLMTAPAGGFQKN